jgi:hypothetical protein
LRAVRESADDGLDPEDYLLRELERARADIDSGETSPQTLIDFDILQTDALARLLDHLVFGKVAPTSFHPHWNFTRPIGKLEPAAFRDEIVESGKVYERTAGRSASFAAWTGGAGRRVRRRRPERVKQLQASHGLDVDGVVGPATLAAVNL